MIDGDRAPRTAQEWNFPEDVTSKVRALAESGRLNGLQLINRQLRRWPDELRRCSDMRTISLIYTSIEEIPNWSKEFKKLQHLHLEGKYGSQNLVTLPPDLFSDLPDFTFLHLGNHHNLIALPAFDGTPNLRSMVLAVLLSLTELPSFDNLPNLETMALAHIQRVPAVPDMAPLVSLSRLAIFRPNHLCCNGFVSACNLADSFCQPDLAFNVPAATCLAPSDPRAATKATKEMFAKFAPAICQKSAIPFALEGLSDFPTAERIASCGGVMYRQCEIPGVTSVNGTVGMCYSSRMQVVACNVDELFIKVRRLEIERGVGPQCDPQVERWLGCSS
ncbi:Homoserine dehydrogenase [Phytophthora cinnamomi]|uniref:Homoserine dehydrogenase n=1 Tax=Phytophthora cinnamomi TaxID=4785 RepID=UPI003559874F|nr:Homoserine dehydrogenase [Phytophthora cinnamomi]